MFCLNVALGNTSWRLLFRDVEKAKAAFGNLTPHHTDGTVLSVEDDFGQTLTTVVSSIHGLMLEDLDQTKMAHVEMALHQARTQSLATKMAQTDQTLKADSMARGPAIIAPMGGNGRTPF